MLSSSQQSFKIKETKAVQISVREIFRLFRNKYKKLKVARRISSPLTLVYTVVSYLRSNFKFLKLSEMLLSKFLSIWVVPKVLFQNRLLRISRHSTWAMLHLWDNCDLTYVCYLTCLCILSFILVPTFHNLSLKSRWL